MLFFPVFVFLKIHVQSYCKGMNCLLFNQQNSFFVFLNLYPLPHLNWFFLPTKNYDDFMRRLAIKISYIQFSTHSTSFLNFFNFKSNFQPSKPFFNIFQPSPVFFLLHILFQLLQKDVGNPKLDMKNRFTSFVKVCVNSSLLLRSVTHESISNLV